jgi:plasmid maintenance system antidote protein VapI
MTPDGLAEQLGVSIETAYQIFFGTQAITQEIATRLASVFRTSPEFWATLNRMLKNPAQGIDRTASA